MIVDGILQSNVTDSSRNGLFDGAAHLHIQRTDTSIIINDIHPCSMEASGEIP